MVSTVSSLGKLFSSAVLDWSVHPSILRIKAYFASCSEDLKVNNDCYTSASCSIASFHTQITPKTPVWQKKYLGCWSKLKWKTKVFHLFVNIVYTLRTTSDVLDSTVSADTTSNTCLLLLCAMRMLTRRLSWIIYTTLFFVTLEARKTQKWDLRKIWQVPSHLPTLFHLAAGNPSWSPFPLIP